MVDEAKFNLFRTKLSDKRAALERAKAVNDQYIHLQTEVTKLQELQQRCYQHNLKLSQLNKVLEAEDAAFRKRRITFLSDHITEILLKIFPADGFKAQIDCDFKRGSGVANLTLKDKYGYERMPDISEGKLCQYLISFASTVGAVESLHAVSVYIDEAFGVSSADNLPKIGEMLQSTSDNGMQIILISQKADLYSEIPHREIHLLLDKNTDTTSVLEIKDY